MDQKELTSRRLLLLLGFFLLVLTIYVGVLYKVQVLEHDHYLAQSVRTIAREEPVEASRGVITDRTGQPMVSSRPSYSLSFDPSLLSDEEDENQALLRLLQLCEAQQVEWTDHLPISKQPPYVYTLDELDKDSTQRKRFTTFLQKELKVLSTNVKAETLNTKRLNQMGLDADTLLDQMRTHYELPASFTDQQARQVLGVQYELSIRQLIHTTAYVLAKDIDATMISLLNDGAYAGAKITSSSIREYQTSHAAHVLGVVGRIGDMSEVEDFSGHYDLDDTVGKTGIERAFEESLKGVDGRRIVSTNSEGKITGEFWSQEPRPGHTVELTLDLEFQAAVEEALGSTIDQINAKDHLGASGGAVVIKVGTGEILSLASYPSYDPARYFQDYTDLLANPLKPLVNRATSGTYPPGSTLKPLIATAALEEGIITPEKRINCPVTWYYPGSKDSLNCWQRHAPHGMLNVTDAIKVSCNYFFAEMGYQLGMERIQSYMSSFGFGQPTGIEIGEKAGALPENPPGQDQAPWAAIGQSSMAVTPLQLANYTATLVSGGKHCEAHLLKAVKSADNTEVLALGNTEPVSTVPIAPSTLEAVKKGMNQLTHGSLAPYFKNCVVEAGAKTGTAQLGGGKKNNGVFICFAPYEEPEIAVAVAIEKGGAGAALASTAVEILNAYFTAEESPGALPIGEYQLLP